MGTCRVWIAAALVFGCFLLMLIGVDYRSKRPTVPPALENQHCGLPVPPDARPWDQWAWDGGRTTRDVKVWRQGISLTTDNVAEGRDLRRYETLEIADPVPRVVVDRRGEPIRALARSFLWEHWRDRKQAYLMLTASSVDATSTFHVFVEKNDSGRWRVYWRIVRHHGEIDDSPTDYDIRWASPANWDQPGTPLAPGQQPDPMKHHLQFRDVCGDWEGDF